MDIVAGSRRAGALAGLVTALVFGVAGTWPWLAAGAGCWFSFTRVFSFAFFILFFVVAHLPPFLRTALFRKKM
jgi:hypothetical protein